MLCKQDSDFAIHDIFCIPHNATFSQPKKTPHHPSPPPPPDEVFLHTPLPENANEKLKRPRQPYVMEIQKKYKKKTKEIEIETPIPTGPVIMHSDKT